MIRQEGIDMEHTLDITDEHCPMTMVKVTLKLAQLAKQDVLCVLMTAGEPLENVPRTAQEQGHVVLGIKPEGDNYRVRIEKGG